MGIVAADQHQQAVFLRHVDQVRHRHHAVPRLGNDLQLCRNANLLGRAVALADRVRLPLRRREPNAGPKHGRKCNNKGSRNVSESIHTHLEAKEAMPSAKAETGMTIL